MIERLVTGLRALAALPAAEPPDAAARRVAADCADAVRLELDCPQQELTRAQRERLRRLGDVLEDGGASAADVRVAAAEAARALGLAPAEARRG